jgi:hypothetical protein
MSFEGNIVKPKEHLAFLNSNVEPYTMNKIQRVKLERASQTFGRESWTLDDLHKNLKLNNVCVDPHNALDSDLVLCVEVEEVFGKRTHNGWKPKLNEHLTPTNCVTLLKLYESVYAHPPYNGQYSTIFLCS